MTRTLAAGLFIAASATVFAQAPVGSATTQRGATQPRPSATAPQSESRGEQTLTGCLTSADNIYTLTIIEDSRVPGSTAQTIVYTLSPGSGVDLHPHLNKRVTVKGTDAGPDAQSSNRIVSNEPASPAAVGTSGTKPTVETNTKTRITAKTLNVTDVQPASGGCGA